MIWCSFSFQIRKTNNFKKLLYEKNILKKYQKNLQKREKSSNFAVQKGKIALALSYQLAEFEHLRPRERRGFWWSYFCVYM